MSGIVFLYAAGDSEYALKAVDGEKSAYIRSYLWACNFSENKIQIITDKKNKSVLEEVYGEYASNIDYLILDENRVSDLLSIMSLRCTQLNGSYAVYAWADCPLLNYELTEKLISNHVEYEAEYTYADGYPDGITPEIIDAGALNIIRELSCGVQKKAGEKCISRDAVFSVMSGDINAFEIETVISGTDYRLLRLSLNCESKLNYLTCRECFAVAGKNSILPDEKGSYNAESLFDLAKDSPSVLHTVPSFYNVQLTSAYNHKSVYNPFDTLFGNTVSKDMSIDDFKTVISKINAFSGKAVVSLSLWGEPLLLENITDYVREVLKYEGLSVLIETDGLKVTAELVKEISLISTDRIDWIVMLDATDSVMYAKINNAPQEDYEKALKSVQLLSGAFKGHVYPQMTRMTLNEEQLETFYRFWKDDGSLSGGNLIIQKYDSFCNALDDMKSADLSPLKRNVCWHLRRDMCILSDGSVVLCRETGKENVTGNIISEEADLIWKRYNEEIESHIKNNYSCKCKVCDEYYTFNF